MRAIREDYRLTAIVVVSVLLIVILDVRAIDGSSVEVNEGESNCIPQNESRPPEPVSKKRTKHDPDCYFDSDEDPVPLPDGQKHCGCIIWFPEATNICCLRKDISTDPNDHHGPSECLPVASFSAHDSNSKWFSTFQRVCNPCITHSSIKKVRYDHIK